MEEENQLLVSFRSTDGRQTSIATTAEAYAKWTVEHFLGLATTRYNQVFCEELKEERSASGKAVFVKAVSMSNGMLAKDDLLKVMHDVTSGGQLTLLLEGEKFEQAAAHAGPKSNKSKGTFTVIEKEVFDMVGRPTGEVEKILRIDDRNTASYLGQVLPNNEEIYKPQPKIPLDQFLPVLDLLKKTAKQEGYDMYLSELAEYVDQQFEAMTLKIKALRDKGKISFSTMWHLFPEASQAFGFVNDLCVGMNVDRTAYHGGMFPGLAIHGTVIKTNGLKLLEVEHQFFIPRFDGVVEITELPAQPMVPEVLAELKTRGAKFSALAIGHHFKMYSGVMLYKAWWSTTKFKANGRIMVDGGSFNQLNPNYKEFEDPHHRRGRGESTQNDQKGAVPADKLFMTWPTIGGFSFKNKKWGEIIVDNVEPLVWDQLAFQRLVLPADQKALIQALVEKQGDTISDFIEGKGGGCIFLLHGPPGVGKTLTAESISEHLERPLYSISVGELGTETDTLETKLSEVLEVAVRWNAVILLDEADIFLERRTLNDIKRNALVGIFLRLLEYHTGVLFLTSNRVKSFDPAFHSRISVALRYPGLHTEDRKQIWAQLLRFAKLENHPLNVNRLAAYDLNGRQIRTTIKLATSLALKEGVTVTQEHFDRCVRIADKFRQDLAASGLEFDVLAEDLSTSRGGGGEIKDKE